MATLKPKPPWIPRYAIFQRCKLNLSKFCHLQLYLMLCCKQSTLLCMSRIQVTRDWSSLNVNTPSDPNFLFVVLPFKWLKVMLRGCFNTRWPFSWVLPLFPLHPWPLPIVHLSMWCSFYNKGRIHFYRFLL